ncbi:glycoside hydrolase [Vararia minispora EC-137]|uniref:Glycoside hydrolase n=1 Tax=Vararia minispora EC-137 TaxID=1314806 RepID=A0ACB8QYZ4_9AGAM|nr:glycoside hydrolase [Vararia minispora EC-137]
MAYYPDWVSDSFPPELIDFTRIDWIDFAFAVPQADFSLAWDGAGDAPRILDRLVQIAHGHGKKVKVSVGGWTGSKHFSPAVATNDSRNTFARNVIDLYNSHSLDGIDIDWEYPSQKGADGNAVDPSDTTNLLEFLRLLRTMLPSSAVITAAAQTVPFSGSSGSPSSDVHEFAAVLDWVLMMNYDTWGESSDPGANAPLQDACGNATYPEASADAAVKQWTNAGFPPSKLVLGLPAYGYVSKSSAYGLRQRDVMELLQEEGGGQIQFRDLVKQGALCASTTPGDPAYLACGGFVRGWDACSGTPFLRSEAAGQLVSYDDPESIQAKAELARKRGLRGVNFFDVHGDVDGWALVDAARRGLQLPGV